MRNSDRMTLRKLIGKIDLELLGIVKAEGTLDSAWFSTHGKYNRVLARCKARMVIVPVRKNDVFPFTVHERVHMSYGYQLTELGCAILSDLSR